MAKCRFVAPETTRLSLSDGDWIDVKKRLTVGEERAAFQQVVGEVNAEGWRRPNLRMMGIAEVAAYIVDWSFRDRQDKPVAVSVGAIENLDTATFAELEEAIGAHVKAMEAETEAAKKPQDGAIAFAATSSSAA